MRDDRERLLDILEAIQRIGKYVAFGQCRFQEDELVQTWILHHIQVIGEACRGISEEMKQRHPEIPWKEIVGMRNILVHQYFGIDTDAVWAVVQNDLADLKRKIEGILG